MSPFSVTDRETSLGTAATVVREYKNSGRKVQHNWLVNKAVINKMHLLGEYFDEREWLLDFHSPSYIIRKEDLMNATGIAATKNLRETMSSMYLSCTKYDRMYRECINTYGADLITDTFKIEHADCNKVLQAFTYCYKNHQWFNQMKKYHPERFNSWVGTKKYRGFGNSQWITPADI